MEMETNENTTLQEAKDFLNKNYKEGCFCPACKQLVKMYKRKIYFNIARSLIKLYQLDQDRHDYYHIGEFTIHDKSVAIEFALCRQFGLVIEKPKDENDRTKKTSGSWMITEHGKKYVLGQATIPKYIYILQGQRIGCSDEVVNIHSAMNIDFNYAELMASYLPPESGQQGLF